MMESQQRQWAAVSQIQGRNREDRHDGETQTLPPWSHSPAVQFRYLLPSVSLNVPGWWDHVSHASCPGRGRRPPSSDGRKPALVRHGAGLQEPPARPVMTLRLHLLAPPRCRGPAPEPSNTRGQARLQKGEAVKAEGWAQGVPDLQDLMPYEPRWSWCNKITETCMVSVMCLNHPETIHPLPVHAKTVFHKTSP